MKKSYLSRKDSIILSTIEIIDEMGIHEVSIRELANRQGVSEPALYRHYSSKQDIILTVLDYYAQYDGMLSKTIDKKKLNAKEGIIFLVRSYMEYYENYPALTAITAACDILRYDIVLARRMDKILDARKEVFLQVIEKGQQCGEIGTDFSGNDLADIIDGLSFSFILQWRRSKYQFSLKEKVMSVLEILLEKI